MKHDDDRGVCNEKHETKLLYNWTFRMMNRIWIWFILSWQISCMTTMFMKDTILGSKQSVIKKIFQKKEKIKDEDLVGSS